ncbi:hypothetical protein GW17_00015962 [Ensete ventricosum]|nr:hypothetical protein GW17_00015962 [Ensete ventricosum]RZS02130.1 hypothetical protein BHM03_00032112 [Ensete ventricosum]
MSINPSLTRRRRSLPPAADLVPPRMGRRPCYYVHAVTPKYVQRPTPCGVLLHNTPLGSTSHATVADLTAVLLNLSVFPCRWGRGSPSGRLQGGSS